MPKKGKQNPEKIARKSIEQPASSDALESCRRYFSESKEDAEECLAIAEALGDASLTEDFSEDTKRELMGILDRLTGLSDTIKAVVADVDSKGADIVEKDLSEAFENVTSCRQQILDESGRLNELLMSNGLELEFGNTAEVPAADTEVTSGQADDLSKVSDTIKDMNEATKATATEGVKTNESKPDAEQGEKKRPQILDEVRSLLAMRKNFTKEERELLKLDEKFPQKRPTTKAEVLLSEYEIALGLMKRSAPIPDDLIERLTSLVKELRPVDEYLKTKLLERNVYKAFLASDPQVFRRDINEWMSLDEAGHLMDKALTYAGVTPDDNYQTARSKIFRDIGNLVARKKELGHVRSNPPSAHEELQGEIARHYDSLRLMVESLIKGVKVPDFSKETESFDNYCKRLDHWRFEHEVTPLVKKLESEYQRLEDSNPAKIRNETEYKRYIEEYNKLLRPTGKQPVPGDKKRRFAKNLSTLRDNIEELLSNLESRNSNSTDPNPAATAPGTPTTPAAAGAPAQPDSVISGTESINYEEAVGRMKKLKFKLDVLAAVKSSRSETNTTTYGKLIKDISECFEEFAALENEISDPQISSSDREKKIQGIKNLQENTDRTIGTLEDRLRHDFTKLVDIDFNQVYLTESQKLESKGTDTTSTVPLPLPTETTSTKSDSGLSASAPTAPDAGIATGGLLDRSEVVAGLEALKLKAAELRSSFSKLIENPTDNVEWTKYLQTHEHELRQLELSVQVIEAKALKASDKVTKETNERFSEAVSILESKLKSIMSDKDKILQPTPAPGPTPPPVPPQSPPAPTQLLEEMPSTPVNLEKLDWDESNQDNYIKSIRIYIGRLGIKEEVLTDPIIIELKSRLEEINKLEQRIKVAEANGEKADIWRNNLAGLKLDLINYFRYHKTDLLKRFSHFYKEEKFSNKTLVRKDDYARYYSSEEDESGVVRELSPTSLAKREMRKAEENFRTAYKDFLKKKTFRQKLGEAFKSSPEVTDVPDELLRLEAESIAAAEEYRTQVLKQIHLRSKRRRENGVVDGLASKGDDINKAIGYKLINHVDAEREKVKEEASKEKLDEMFKSYPKVVEQARRIMAVLPKSRAGRIGLGLAAAMGIGATGAALGALTVGAASAAGAMAGAGAVWSGGRFLTSFAASTAVTLGVGKYHDGRIKKLEEAVDKALEKSDSDLAERRKAARLAHVAVDKANLRKKVYSIGAGLLTGATTSLGYAATDGFWFVDRPGSGGSAVGERPTSPAPAAPSDPNPAAATPAESGSSSVTGATADGSVGVQAQAEQATADTQSEAATPPPAPEAPRVTFDVDPHPVKAGDSLSTILLTNLRAQFDLDSSKFGDIQRADLYKVMYKKFPEMTNAASGTATLPKDKWIELGIRSGDPQRIAPGDNIDVAKLMEMVLDKELKPGTSGQSFSNPVPSASNPVPSVLERNQDRLDFLVEQIRSEGRSNVPYENLANLADSERPDYGLIDRPADQSKQFVSLSTLPTKLKDLPLDATNLTREQFSQAYALTQPPQPVRGTDNWLNSSEYRSYLERNGIKSEYLSESVARRAGIFESNTYSALNRLLQKFDSPFEKLSGVTLGELKEIQARVGDSEVALREALQAKAGGNVTFNIPTINAWLEWVVKAKADTNLPSGDGTTLKDLYSRMVAQEIIRDNFEKAMAARIK